MTDPTKPHTFAERLRTLMTLRKVSREELSEALDVPVSTLGTWIRPDLDKRGLPYVPDFYDLARVAKHFGVAADYLCGLAEEASGLKPGMWILDQRMVDEIERAERLEDIEDHLKRIGGGKPVVAVRSEIPAGGVIVPRSRAEEAQRKVDAKLAKLSQKRGGGKP